jgi:hypothetical protein
MGEVSENGIYNKQFYLSNVSYFAIRIIKQCYKIVDKSSFLLKKLTEKYSINKTLTSMCVLHFIGYRISICRMLIVLLYPLRVRDT